jgi:hypothetical protein
MPFARYVPEWDGFQGAPGYTVLHFNGAPDNTAAGILAESVHDFFLAIANRLPGDATINFPGEMTLHDDLGTLVGAVPVTPVPAVVEATGIGAYAAPTGARVTWETGTIVGGRRLRGRTFIVPMVAGSYDLTGTILETTITQIELAANTLVSESTALGHPLVVWSPTGASVSPVTAGIVPDQATVLRSRRD